MLAPVPVLVPVLGPGLGSRVFDKSGVSANLDDSMSRAARRRVCVRKLSVTWVCRFGGGSEHGWLVAQSTSTQNRAAKHGRRLSAASAGEFWCRLVLAQVCAALTLWLCRHFRLGTAAA